MRHPAPARWLLAAAASFLVAAVPAGAVADDGTTGTTNVTYVDILQGNLGIQVCDSGCMQVLQQTNIAYVIVAQGGTALPGARGYLQPDLSYGDVTQSKTLTATLTNQGSMLLAIYGIDTGGANPNDFTETDGCTVNGAGGVGILAPGASCDIAVSFDPLAAGSRGAWLAVGDNAVDSPQRVNLSGKGVTPVLAPDRDFGDVAVGTTSAALPITLANPGSDPLTLGSIEFKGDDPGDFTQTNDCPAALPAGGSCVFQVSFTPSQRAARSATLRVHHHGLGGFEDAAVSGTGVVPGATLSPALDFGGVTVGSASTRDVTYASVGEDPVTISAIGFSGAQAADFSATSSCGPLPSTISVDGTCLIHVTFRPGATGARAATLSVTDNADGSPRSVGLAGSGLAPQPVIITTTISATLTGTSFGSLAVGSSAVADAILKNTGNAALSITAMAVSGANAADFTIASGCGTLPATLAAGASCPIHVTFKPAAAGSRTATLSVTDNAGTSPQSAALSGTGLAIAPTASPTPAPTPSATPTPTPSPTGSVLGVTYTLPSAGAPPSEPSGPAGSAVLLALGLFAGVALLAARRRRDA